MPFCVLQQIRLASHAYHVFTNLVTSSIINVITTFISEEISDEGYTGFSKSNQIIHLNF